MSGAPDNKGKGKAIAWLREHVSYQGDDCLKWRMCSNPNGYGQMGYDGKRGYAHRVMCELAHGPCPDGHEAAHSCGNGKLGCVNPRHLSWKTKSENRLDALRHGTGVIKRTGNRGSLRPEQVDEIRSLKGQVRQVDIAERFGISPPRVRAIFTNKIYRDDRKLRQWTQEDDDRLREGIARGRTHAEMAVDLGRSLTAIAGYASKHGIRSA